MKLSLPVRLALLGAWLAPSPALAQTPVPAATIVSVEGPVTWRAEAEALFKEARGGEALFAGAVVRTGARGSARLKWRNGGDFRLLPLSELAVPEDAGVLLNAGKVWAQFQEKLLGPFYFKSPTATAVIRGTTLGVEIGPEGTTTVAVLEGRVEVTSARGGPSRMLEPGQSLTVSPMGGLGPIMPVDPGVRLFERQGPSSPQGPDGRPQGPGPARPAAMGPRPEGAFDWLQRNRATVRLEDARQQERRRMELRVGPGAPDMRERPAGDRPMAIRHHQPPGVRERGPGAPDGAFPAGRPEGPAYHPPLPGCDPNAPPPPPGVTPECPPPPPPPAGGAR